jgi:formate hydrogenlyase subunit 3/multisubunit Na+/H+ antiporter MnhD subunit
VIGLCIGAIAVLLLGAVAAALAGKHERVASGIGLAAAFLGLGLAAVPTGLLLAGAAPSGIDVAWHVPHGATRLEIDPLSAVFLAPVCAIGAVGSLWARAQRAFAGAERRPGHGWAAFLALLAALLAVPLVRGGLAFLVAWESMSLCAWVLVAWDHHDASVRRAGWTYLVAAHVATAALLLCFTLMNRHLGQPADFTTVAATAPTAVLLQSLPEHLGGIGSLVPVDLFVPGCPPHPITILDGLLRLLGRRVP